MLKLEHVRKHYGDFCLDCSLEVRPGCVTGLIGKNGAGKSTTFKAILGLIHTDGGTITLLGKNVQDISEKEKEKLGVVLSDSGISEYLDIRDTAAILEGFYPSFQKKDFIEKCRKYRLPADKKIKDFSTGMRAKLKLLIAVTHEADFLLLDEPTAGLDVTARDSLLNILREYMEDNENRGILISSHISSDLEGICDDLYMIHDGKVILHEDTDVLLSCYGLLKLNEEQYSAVDKKYLLRVKREPYGYCALTDQKQFYMENYPGAVIENSGIDEMIMMMTGGNRI